VWVSRQSAKQLRVFHSFVTCDTKVNAQLVVNDVLLLVQLPHDSKQSMILWQS
jgi:hypothetical protein